MSAQKTLDQTLEQADPEVARLVEQEFERQSRTIRLIPSENYVSRAVLEATGTVLTNKYSEGYARQALLRGPAGHRPDRDARHRARQGAVRRRARQRAALLGLARQPRRLPRLPQAGRHDHGHGAAGRRPPHARLERLGHRQVLPARSSTACAARPTASTSTRCATLARKERPKLIFCGGTAIPRTIDFAAFAAIAQRGRRDPRRRHRAHRRPGRRRRAPLAGRPRRRASRRRRTRRCAARAAACSCARRSTPRPSTRPSSPACRAARTTTPPPASRSRSHEAAAAGVHGRTRTRSSRTRKALAEALVERGFDLVSGGTDNHLILVDLTPKDVAGKVGRQGARPGRHRAQLQHGPLRPAQAVRSVGHPPRHAGGHHPRHEGARDAADRPLDRRGSRGGQREDESAIERIAGEVRELTQAFPIPGAPA